VCSRVPQFLLASVAPLRELADAEVGFSLFTLPSSRLINTCASHAVYLVRTFPAHMCSSILLSKMLRGTSLFYFLCYLLYANLAGKYILNP
jgi:hypothetical protein